MGETKITDRGIAETYKVIAGANGVVAPASFFLGPIALVDWGMPAVVPEFYSNFCALVEAVVFNDRILSVGIEYDEPLVNSLREADILVDALKFGRDESNRQFLLNLIGGTINIGPLITPYFRKVNPILHMCGLSDKFWPYLKKAQAVDVHILSTAPLIPKSNSENPIEIFTHEFLEGIARENSLQSFITPLIENRVNFLLHAFDTPLIIKQLQNTFYDNLKEYHQDKIDKLRVRHPYLGITAVEIPPLTTILLERCRGDRNQIVKELLNLREEFAEARKLQRSFIQRTVEARTFDELNKVDQDFDEIWKALSKKLSTEKTRLVYRVWNYIKLLDPKDIFVKLVDDAISHEKGIEHYKAFSTYYSLLNESLQADFQVDLIAKTF
ncbi:hypothetical protein KA005_20995, partial [bacterium]|nr:hypothetical protein [bacterium]